MTQDSQSSADQAGGESPEALHEALRETQRRLAYFERFGTLVQEQMAAVVEKATSVSQDTENRRTELDEEIARLQAEAELLRRQADHHQSDVDEAVNRARQEATATLRRIQDAAREILDAALLQLTSLQQDLGQAIEVPTSPASDSNVTGNPSSPGTAEIPAPEYAVQDDRSSRATSEPSETAQPIAPSPDSHRVGTTTRLIIRPVLSYDELMSLQQKLIGKPGVTKAELGGINDDMCEVLVTHADDTSLEGSLLAMEDMDLRLTARGEGYVEVELGGTGAAPA
jgi:hypothetical protein